LPWAGPIRTPTIQGVTFSTTAWTCFWMAARSSKFSGAGLSRTAGKGVSFAGFASSAVTTGIPAQAEPRSRTANAIFQNRIEREKAIAESLIAVTRYYQPYLAQDV